MIKGTICIPTDNFTKFIHIGFQRLIFNYTVENGSVFLFFRVNCYEEFISFFQSVTVTATHIYNFAVCRFNASV